MTTTFETAKAGDRVFDIFFNQWYIIIDNVPKDKFPIKTKDSSYTLDGKPKLTYGRTLFWDEIIITPPTKPAPKLEVDTKVLVWNTDDYPKKRRHFSHFDSNNNICVFVLGGTSWTNSQTSAYPHWELAKD